MFRGGLKKIGGTEGECVVGPLTPSTSRGILGTRKKGANVGDVGRSEKEPDRNS